MDATGDATLAEQVGRLLHAADAVAMDVDSGGTELDLETAAYCREALVEVRRILGDTVSGITAAMCAELDPKGDGKRYSSPLGTHERHNSTVSRSEWDPDLAAKVLNRVLEEADLLPQRRRLVAQLIVDHLPAGFSWRVGTWPKGPKPGTGLRGLGFDPGDWCRETDSGAGVQFTASDVFRDRLYRWFADVLEKGSDHDDDRPADERERTQGAEDGGGVGDDEGITVAG